MNLGMLTDEMAAEAMTLAKALEDSQGQSGINGGAGWQRVFLSVASACDAMRAILTGKAEEAGAVIVLPVLEGFGDLRTYLGRAGRVEGMGDLGRVIAELVGVADDFWWAAEKIGVPRDKLPARDRGSWAASWEHWSATGRVQMALALLARGLLDLRGVLDSWRSAPVEAVPKQRKRA